MKNKFFILILLFSVSGIFAFGEHIDDSEYIIPTDVDLPNYKQNKNNNEKSTSKKYDDFLNTDEEDKKEIPDKKNKEKSSPKTNDDDLLFGGSSSSSDDSLFGDISSSSDDSLFGDISSSNDDSLFGDSSSSEDSLFGGEDFSQNLVSVENTGRKNSSSLFEIGAIKIGGSFKTGLNTNTFLYNPNDSNFGNNLKNTRLSPILSAMLSIDARPTETLRMYAKFGMNYPFTSKVMLNLSGEDLKTLKELQKMIEGLSNPGAGLIPGIGNGGGALKPDGGNGGTGGKPDGKPDGGTGENPNIGDIIDSIISGNGNGNTPGGNSNNKPENKPDNKPQQNQNGPNIAGLGKKITVQDWFTLKELFTDFSIKNRVFFRFGLHTVSWGTGFFFSPVSDMINSSQINPENPTEQVGGSLNLRAQVVFPNTQNCLWLYLIPSNKFENISSGDTYLKDTGFGSKFDLVLGGWELGFGSLFKIEDASKLMITASGSIKKLSIFSEMVFQIGAADEWKNNKSLNGKTGIFQFTVGGFYSWKDPGIMLAMQYYFDSNNIDFMNRIYTNGHNLALMVNFSKIGNVKNLSASFFTIANFGRAGLNEQEKAAMEEMGAGGLGFPCLMINTNIAYSPVDNISFTAGPSLLFTDYNKKPSFSLKLGVTLGGGKF